MPLSMSHYVFKVSTIDLHACLQAFVEVLDDLVDRLFFCLLVLCHASNNTTSPNIGGADAWAVLPPKIFLGTVSAHVPAASSIMLGQTLQSSVDPCELSVFEAQPDFYEQPIGRNHIGKV